MQWVETLDRDGGKEHLGGQGGPGEKQHGWGNEGVSKAPLQLNGEGTNEVGRREKAGKSSRGV